MPKKKRKIKRVPPSIGKAERGAKTRMAELYEGIITSIMKNGTYRGREKEVASRRAWNQFKQEYRKDSTGKWVKRKKRISYSQASGMAKKGKRNPKPRKPPKISIQGEYDKAKRVFKDFHWGDKPEKTTKGKIYVPRVVVSLGDLKAIDYKAKKRNRTHIYRHVFKKPLPVLASDVEGKQLFIIGGNYKIKPEGIVG